MVTAVLVEEVEVVEHEEKFDRIETAAWYYRMPCASVKCFRYEQESFSASQIDHWSSFLDGLKMR